MDNVKKMSYLLQCHRLIRYIQNVYNKLEIISYKEGQYHFHMKVDGESATTTGRLFEVAVSANTKAYSI